MSGYSGWNSSLPRKGWLLQDVIDLDDLDGTCEMCGTSYRYEHILSHPAVNDTVHVGCVCAERLTEDYVNPRKRERKLKSPIKRLKAIDALQITWRPSNKGLTTTAKPFRATVFPKAGQWSGVVNNVHSKILFATKEEALSAAEKKLRNLLRETAQQTTKDR